MADRLDFTVIGPAVNLVSRIEGVAKALDRPILVSSDFARALGDGVVSLGLHHLRVGDAARVVRTGLARLARHRASSR